jgi:transposase InsO family protein
LYPEQIERWKDAAMAGSADPQRLTRDERAAWQQEKKRVRDLERACLAKGVHRPGLVLHSDNGSPMKGATMLSTLQRLGVVPSFSRPSVSDDNP